MKPLGPIDVVPLFPEERAALLDLLRSFSAEQWALPTVCDGWSVKDIAAHLVADDFGRLSGRRDGYPGWQFKPTSPETFEAELRVFINAHNESWVEGMRRISPRIILDLLEWGGHETQAYFESLDPNAPGVGVSWAGESESANWFDLAREYTERWHHQSQIRDAVREPKLLDPRMFLPVLDTMIRAAPHALRGTDAAVGTHIRVDVTSEVSPTYDIVRGQAGWGLFEGTESEPAAVITMDSDTAWRLLTRNIAREEVVRRATVAGDAVLADAVFDSMALVA